ncbi:MAG: rhombosortase [Candidatus Sedimenticola sp. 20ELBAFRAG]
MKQTGYHNPGHGRLTLPWRSLTLVGLALALYMMLGPAPELLVLDRSGIAAGEWWRLFTGHWVHSDSQHLLMDTAGLFILGLLFEKVSPWRFLILLTGSALSLDLLLWLNLPWIEAYCGLSGLLNAMLSAGMLLMWRKTGDWVYPLIWVIAAGKILTELYLGQAIFSETLWPSVPEAHAYGLFTGALLGSALFTPTQTVSAESPASLRGL